jgi:putative transcriptional regulator
MPSGGEGPPRPGALLVATPVIGDPNFERAVVLLLHHDESGSLGIVLNRPSELEVDTALPAWSPLATPPGVVHIGGPVGPSGVLALARTGSDQPPPSQGWAELSPGLGAVDLSLEPDELGAPLQALRLYAGYAGWGPTQLAGELAVGAWWVFDALIRDAFSAEPTELWWEVVRRQGGDFRMFAHAPLDPTVN